MTLNEARRQLDQAKIRMTEAHMGIGETWGPERQRKHAAYLAAMREAAELKALVRELSDREHLGFVAGNVGMETPALEAADRESADVLLLEALNALVDLKCEWRITDRIRAYFRQMPAERADNSELDFSKQRLYEAAQPVSPVAVEPLKRELPKPEPVPLKTPSPIRYLDAHGRAAPGPGAVLYGRKRA